MGVDSVIYLDFCHWTFTHVLQWPRVVPIRGNIRGNWICGALLYRALASITFDFL